ncbi:hypothetical protein BTE28158_03056 [Burkholderia territorii]|nr:hypothetical protein BTE28158_03056 [Burkholderia territorii]
MDRKCATNGRQTVHMWASLSPQRQSTVYNCRSPVKKGNMDHNVKVFDLLYEVDS